MKKILHIILVLGASAAVFSCTRDFDKINTNPNAISTVVPDQLLAPALTSAIGYNMIRNRNFNNELMQVTVTLTEGEGSVFRYDYRPNMSDYLYNGLYSEITNFRDVYKSAAAAATPNKSYMGISLICQSWLYSILTDTYGDIPYIQANQGKGEDGSIVEPAFDRQQDIYLTMFDTLEKANMLLTAGDKINADADPVYHGDVSKWRKFGNSLYLRLLLRVSGKQDVSQKVISKIQQIVDANPEDYPIMTDNDESAILRWTGVSPYISPYVNRVRAQDFRAVALCDFFINNLLIWSDPRLDGVNYGIDGINRLGISKSNGFYMGTPSGYTPGEDVSVLSHFYAIDETVAGKTPPAITMQSEAKTGMMLNYAEVQFMLAEAAAKGWISGPAQKYYEQGAKSSITLWVSDWNGDIEAYLSNAGMQWDENASIDNKMEKIMLQKYYALLFTDLQQWFEYRRTGHPVLPKGRGLKNDGIMPARMVYPAYIQSTNPTNYKQAIANQGPDKINTQVWWQKP
ncbi:MAG: SusD/RagB family nutrient-binding outer membrane lipoprotein [Niabella sp.]